MPELERDDMQGLIARGYPALKAANYILLQIDDSARAGTWLERYQKMQLSLHTGAILGTPTKLLALLTCVALVLQIASGYVLWLKKRG